MWSSLLKISSCFNLKIGLSYQTLSKALDKFKICVMPKLEASNSTSKDVKILWVIVNGWLIEESLG